MSTNYPGSIDGYSTGDVDNITVISAAESNNLTAAVLALEKYGLPVFNVRTYGGAKGDGTTDDSTAIQNTLNAASAAGGGIAWVPTGNYRLGSRIFVPWGCELRGSGRNSAFLTALGSFPASTELIRLGDLSGNIGVACRCSDLRIDCNNVTGSIGVYSERINENSGLYRCSISNYGSRGVQIKQPASGGSPQHFTIDDVEIYSGSGTGASAIGLDIAMTSLTIPVRVIRAITVFATGNTQLTTAMKVDGVTGPLQSIHVENAVTGILVGSVLGCFGLSIRDVDGMTNVGTLVVISNATTQRSITLIDLAPSGATNALNDQQFTNTITTDVGLYVIGRNTWVLASDGTVVDQFGRVRIGKDLQRSHQAPSETVLVSGVDATAGELVGVTLTAARVVGAPLNPATGQRLTFTLIQNGTGGWAVTWNAVFKVTWADTGNTANKRSSVSFHYDGTSWNQDGAQAPYV